MAKRRPGKKTLNTTAVTSKMAQADRKPTRAKKTPPHWQKGEVEAPAEDAPAHVARCAQCPAGVKYQLLQSGHGLVVLERYAVDVQAGFGIGDGGLPLCPNGHGEMTIADETMPATEAIRQVAEKVNGGAHQPQLFDTAKPFNFEGAWMDVAQKSQLVSQLAREHDEDAERAKKSKKALEAEEALLRRMITTYDERRIQKARDEQRRAEAADGLEALCVRLNAISVPFDVASARALSSEQRSELVSWALDAEQHPNERDRWMAVLPIALSKAEHGNEPVAELGAAPIAPPEHVVAAVEQDATQATN